MFTLNGRTAVVTGGSRGIGLEIVRALAECGANVALIATRENKETAEEIGQKFGVRCESFACDVSDSQSVASTFSQIEESLGPVDILVNNAGITRDGLLMRMKDEDFDDVIRVNLRSVFLCTRAVIRQMMKRRQGRIINMASINGIRTQAGQANYAASKAGLIGMTKSNAMEFASRGITVNAVAPGFIQTAMTDKIPTEMAEKYKAAIPLQSFGTPRDVAYAVAFLASDEARYITGQVLGVDGGLNS